MTCAKCGSTKVIPRARVIDRGDYSADVGNVRVGVARKPQAWIFKGQEKADIYARLCGACGYAELFVEDAAAIFRAYEESRQNGE
jgi:uncharacterized OB-fold protein